MERTKYNPSIFPFTAIVGQELLKLGLVLNAINPKLGGILIRGEKGTAKSTAARSLSRLLSAIEVVVECPYRCNPSNIQTMCMQCRSRKDAGETLHAEKTPLQVVDLPLNTTEDRLVGGIDFENTLRAGVRNFQPGLLAEANRGIIYIDEVNLLENHLVDILLDTAVTGINIVQRESISVVHPAHFILIATMNPEEGDIRPQLLDRFGFSVSIRGLSDPKQRMEVIRRREHFDSDPDGFIQLWEKEQDLLRKRIKQAQQCLSEVMIREEQLSEISGICMSHQVAGHRADILLEKTARTLAAFDGRRQVDQNDILKAMELVLKHRTRLPEGKPQRRKGRADSGSSHNNESGLDPAAGESIREKDPDMEAGDLGGGDQFSRPVDRDAASAKNEPAQAAMAAEITGALSGTGAAQVFDIGDRVTMPSKKIEFPKDHFKRRAGGRRTLTSTPNKTGRYVRSTAERLNNDLAFDATLRAAAPYQKIRTHGNLAVTIRKSDIREKVRQKKTSNLLLFVVDASGSMGTKLMTETKSTILALLIEAYQKRDKVSMVAFRDMDAQVLLPPTNSIEIAKKMLEELPTGGKTPLGKGLLTSYRLIKMQLRQDPGTLPLMVIITDGRANVGLHTNRSYEGPRFGEIYREISEICRLFQKEKKVRAMVIDVEEKSTGSFDQAKKLAEELNASWYVLEDIISRNIIKTVKKELE
ncbi:MAG: magnesium chelatase subunit D family protein [Desulfobacterales bacterium]